MGLVTYALAGSPRVGVIVSDGSVVATRDLIPEFDEGDMLAAIAILAEHEDLHEALANAARTRSGGMPIEKGPTARARAAMDHVFGYTCANDVSVRDVQRRHGGQWFKGKNFDTHLPMGPWIGFADEVHGLQDPAAHR